MPTPMLGLELHNDVIRVACTFVSMNENEFVDLERRALVECAPPVSYRNQLV